MPRALLHLTAALSLATLLLAADATRAAPRKSDSEVKVSATAAKPDADGKQVLTVTLKVNPGWHAYANPVGNELFKDNATLVTVRANGKALDAAVDYPAGKSVTLGGETVKVYEDSVTIKATVQRPKDLTGPLEVNVTLQVCNNEICLLPGTVKVSVPEKK